MDLGEADRAVIALHGKLAKTTGDKAYIAARALTRAFTWSSTKQGDEFWRKTFNALEEMHRNDQGGLSSDSNNSPSSADEKVGRITTSTSLINGVEQLLADIKATLEAESKKHEPDKKTVKFMTYALHQIGGFEELEQRGVLERLKDAS